MNNKIDNLYSIWLNKINEISFKISQQIIYDELNYSVKNKWTYFKPITNNQRGIGKTFTLIQLALKYNYPIIIPQENWKWHTLRLCKDHFDKVPEIIIINNLYDLQKIRRKKYEVILCEEQVNFNVLQELQLRGKILIGFY